MNPVDHVFIRPRFPPESLYELVVVDCSSYLVNHMLVADYSSTHFQVKLGILDYALHTLNQIQRKWVYLEPIFGMGALPAEQGRFRRVEEEFRDIMAKVRVQHMAQVNVDLPMCCVDHCSKYTYADPTPYPHPASLKHRSSARPGSE